MVHRETRSASVYALIVAKKGPKLKAGDGGPKGTGMDENGGYEFKNWTMSDLANSLSMMPGVGRTVLDRTGLAGSYFHAKLTERSKTNGPDTADFTQSDDPVFWALQDQLGLKLDARKELVDFLVIDHADRIPVPN